MDLQKQMDMIGHNYKMIHRNSLIMFGNILDALPCDPTQVCQRNIIRAIGDRPYIRSEEVFAVLGADGDKIGIGRTVIIFG